MTETQQYRVVADRDKGDDPQWTGVRRGDRYTAVSDHTGLADEDDPLIRIERPVPTANEPHADGCLYRDGGLERWCTCRPHPPTREQIAEALYLDDADHEDWSWASETNPLTRAAKRAMPTAPPSIADMVPGMCTECRRAHRLEEDSEFHLGLVCSECGALLLPIGTWFIGQEHAGDLDPLVFTISRRGAAVISKPSAMGWAASDIDPSTIRDVTPPAAP